MKNNILVLILVLGILILGFLYMKEKGSNDTDVLIEEESSVAGGSNTPTQNPATSNGGARNTSPSVPTPVNPDWQSISSSSTYNLATTAGVSLSPGSSVSLSQSLDLTGDGIDEGVFSGDGGNSGMSFIVMKDLNGQNVLAKQKNKNGSISVVQLLSVGRAMVSESFKLIPEHNGFYTISKSNDSEGMGFNCNTDGVNVYSWNNSTKLFEWNQSLSLVYTEQECN